MITSRAAAPRKPAARFIKSGKDSHKSVLVSSPEKNHARKEAQMPRPCLSSRFILSSMFDKPPSMPQTARTDEHINV